MVGAERQAEMRWFMKIKTCTLVAGECKIPSRLTFPTVSIKIESPVHRLLPFSSLFVLPTANDYLTFLTRK
jgi:hypothetical protein